MDDMSWHMASMIYYVDTLVNGYKILLPTGIYMVSIESVYLIVLSIGYQVYTYWCCQIFIITCSML